jgi:hypothetical protein
MPSRATLIGGTASLLIAGALAALPAGAAPGGGGCQLAGNAKFTHGPSSTDHPFTYTFTGKLTNCHDSTMSGPASGTVGTLVPAKGTGSCASGTTAGVALIKWADRTQAIVKYTTNDAAAAVVLQGNVIPKYKVRKKTYKTTRYAGAGALATLTFQADPTQCAGRGVTTAPIQGFAGLGQYT